MDFRLSDEQKLMIDAARKVGDRFGLEYWRKQDAAKAFPKEFWLAVCESGLCGAALPTEVGG
ncbi:MAG TPA: acyl-CoA dehydrogenase family protein, partial [Burkholderiaceae bacterium]